MELLETHPFFTSRCPKGDRPFPNYENPGAFLSPFYFHLDIYSGSQKSEVCPRRPMPTDAYAHGCLCPRMPMPSRTSYERSKGYILESISGPNYPRYFIGISISKIVPLLTVESQVNLPPCFLIIA